MRRGIAANKFFATFMSFVLVTGLWPVPVATADTEGARANQPTPAAVGEVTDTPAGTDDALANGTAAPDTGEASGQTGEAEGTETPKDTAEGTDQDQGDGQSSADATTAPDTNPKDTPSTTTPADKSDAPAADASGAARQDEAVAGAATPADKPADDAAPKDDSGADAQNKDDDAKEDEKYPAIDARQKASNGVLVSVHAPEGAFPEGTHVSVSAADSKLFSDATSEALGVPVGGAEAVDISFTKDGNELEPKDGIAVSVRLKLDSPLPVAMVEPDETPVVDSTGLLVDALVPEWEEPKQVGNYVVMHLLDTGRAQRVNATSTTSEDAAFMARDFSVYGLASVPTEEMLQAESDEGGELQAQAVEPGGSATLTRTGQRAASFAGGGTQNTISLGDSGLFMLNVAGAKGGNTTANGKGGDGGTSVAVMPLYTSDADTLYAVNGGQGVVNSGSASTPGGANGGGGGGSGYNSGYIGAGSGGGATHIATVSGELGTLASVANSSLLIVAGGGGGAGAGYWGGAGGGATGQVGYCHKHWANPAAGGQSSGTGSGVFGVGSYGGNGGKGGTGSNCRQGHGGGGGGYYGGGSRGTQRKDNANAGGGGGSGFLNGALADGTKDSSGGSVSRNFVTTGGATESTTVGSTSQGGNSGDGTSSVEYIASIVDLNKQNATVQGTKNVYSAPMSDTYYLTYSTAGMGPATTTITPPSRPGWSFRGYWTDPAYNMWIENGDSGDKFIDASGTIVSDDTAGDLYEQGTTTLYAHMDPDWYTVTLDPGDTSVAGTTAVYERYETGIYADKDYEDNKQQIYTITIPERDAVITYDGNGGSSARANENVKQEFKGYYDGDVQLIDGNGVVLESFTPDRFTKDATLTGTWGEGTAALPQATRDGYEFLGWYDGDNKVGMAGDPYSPTSPTVTLTAHWKPCVYEIALDNDAATTDGTSAVYLQYDNGKFQDAECETPATSITVPQRTYDITYNTNGEGTLPEGQENPQAVSYTFDGYFTPLGGSSKLIGATGSFESAFTNKLFTKDVTLHAQWTPGHATLPTPTPSPSAPELQFLGWSPEQEAHSGMHAGSSYTPTEDTTLYAQWAEIWYTISYENVDGAIGFNPPDMIDLGKSTEPLNAEFTVPKPVRPGYEFTGWNISGMTSQEHWIGGESTTATSANNVMATSFKTLQTEDKANVTFSANWKPITKEIALDDQGATTPGTQAVYQAYEQDVYKTKNGDEYADPMGEGESGANPITIPAKSYQVTYDLNGKGSDTPTPGQATYDFGGYFTELNGGGTQLISSTGHRMSEFTNTFYRGDAVDPTAHAKWSGGKVQLASYTSQAAGFRFIGWAEDSTATSPDYLPGDELTLTEGKTLYAVYDEPTYVVAYSANGGTGTPDSQIKAYNVPLQLSDTFPTRADSVSDGAVLTFNANGGTSTGDEDNQMVGLIDSTWTFSKWTTHVDGTGDSYDADHLTYTANEGATLHAQWDEHPTRRTMTLPTPVYEGYKCEGWFTAAAGGTKVGDAGQEIEQPTDNQTLFAHWSALEYDVVYVDGDQQMGITDGCVYDVSFTLKTAEELGLVKDGWEFAGWTREKGSLDPVYSDGATVQNLSTSTGIVEMHAIWSRDLTFISGLGEPNLDGQSEAGSLKLTTQAVVSEQVSQFTDGETLGSVTAPEIAPIDRFMAVGWTTDGSELTGKVDFEAGEEVQWAKDDVTFYAQYERDASVAYDGGVAASGTTEDSMGLQYYNASGTLGKATVTLAQNNFTRKGFTFGSWDLGAPGEEYSWQPQVSEDAMTTAHAVWIDDMQYLVRFNANGGEGTMEPQVMDIGVAAKLSANAFKRDGFEFDGWNTKADGSGKAFADGESVTDLATSGEEIMLYAQWKAVPAAAASADSSTPAASGTTTNAEAAKTATLANLPKTGETFALAAIALACLVAAAFAFAIGFASRRSQK